MSGLMFYPEDGIYERAEIHAEYADGSLLTDRIVGKVDAAAAPTRDAAPHPRLTRGRHLDELEAVEESVDGHLRELQQLTGRLHQIEAEVERTGALYRRVITVGAAVAGTVGLILTLVVVVLVLTHR